MILQSLRERCKQNGIDCFVASQINRDAIPGDYIIGSKIESLLHALLSRIGGKQAYYSRFATLRLIRYIDKLKPDIVHLHNLHNNYVNVNMLLRYLAKNQIKTVITLHDCWWYTGGCYHYTTVDCSKWLIRCGHCPKRYLEIPALLCDCSAKIHDDRKKYLLAIKDLTIVGVSDWISGEASKSFLRGRKILTIYNGIDFNVFKPTPSRLRSKYGIEDKYVLLGPANKWLDEINKPVLSYFMEHMGPNFVLFLMGHSGKNFQFGPQIRFLPYTNDKKELAEIYSMADVFVNCTREESLGLVNIEAQLCGTPVVTFSGTGISETVPVSGQVPVGNAKDLFSKCLCPPEPDPVFLARFDSDITYQSYISVYLA